MLLRFPLAVLSEGNLRVSFSKKIHSLVSNKGSQPPETESEHVHWPVFMASLARPAREESLDLLSDPGLNAGIGLLTPRCEARESGHCGADISLSYSSSCLEL